MKPKTLVPPRQTPLHHILGLTFLIGEIGTKSTNPLYAVQVKIALNPPHTPPIQFLLYTLLNKWG